MRPIGNPAPPRPRTPDARSSSITCWGSIASALRSDWYPPTRSYSEKLGEVDLLGVLEQHPPNRHGAPSRSPARPRLARARGSGGRRRRPDPSAAAAGTLDDAQRDAAARGRLARTDPQLALERLECLLSPDQGARDVRADLDQMTADRGQLEHVVEARHCLAVGGRQLEGLGDLAERVRREPASRTSPAPGAARGGSPSGAPGTAPRRPGSRRTDRSSVDVSHDGVERGRDGDHVRDQGVREAGRGGL